MLSATVNKVTPRRICAQFLQKLPGKIVYATTGDTKRMQLAPNAEVLGDSYSTSALSCTSLCGKISTYAA